MSSKKKIDMSEIHRQHQLAEERRAALESAGTSTSKSSSSASATASSKSPKLTPEEEELHRLEQESQALAHKLEHYYSDLDFVFKEPEPKLKDDLRNVLVVDGMPRIDASQVSQLMLSFSKFCANSGAPSFSKDSYSMPIDQNTNLTKGFVYLEFPTAEAAKQAMNKIDGKNLDAQHTIQAFVLKDFDDYDQVSDVYQPPPQKEFVPRNKRSWLLDELCRDQYVVRFGDEIVIKRHDVLREPEVCYRRQSPAEQHLLKWSPLGTYLAIFHPQGIILCGGPNFDELGRFLHPEVALIAFSPQENYLMTAHSQPSKADNKRSIIVWNIQAGKKVHTFYDSGPNRVDMGAFGSGAPWPIFKWSHDDRFFAKLNIEGSEIGISLYEVADSTLVSSKTIEIPGLRDFVWSPSDNIISYWIDNIADKPKEKSKHKNKPQEKADDRPTRVILEELPSRKIVRSKNFFNVSDVKMSWHSNGNFLCVKVDRTKGTSTKVTNLDLFRMRDKDVPVDTIELSDPVHAFAWEPNGLRFAIISGEGTKPNVSFYTMTALKNANTRLIATHEKKTANHLFWSPRGDFIVLAGLKSMGGVFEFWNVANNEMLGKGEHHMTTDVEWDPSGRYLATFVSCYRYQHENGYQIWSFNGKALEKHSKDKFWQFMWRPRPKSLLTEEDNKWIQKNWPKLFAKYDKQYKDVLRVQANKELAVRNALWDKFKAIRHQMKQEYKNEKAKRRALRGGFDSDNEGGDVEETRHVTQEVLDVSEEFLD